MFKTNLLIPFCNYIFESLYFMVTNLNTYNIIINLKYRQCYYTIDILFIYNLNAIAMFINHHACTFG